MNDKRKIGPLKKNVLRMVISLSVVLIFGYFVMLYTTNNADKSMREDFLRNARLVAQAIDVNSVKKLSGTYTDLAMHGFFSQGFVQTTDNNLFADTKDGSFQFNELGINFSRDLTYNQTRDVDMLRTSIFLPQSVYPEILRDTTLSIIGDAPAGGDAPPGGIAPPGGTPLAGVLFFMSEELPQAIPEGIIRRIYASQPGSI